MERMKFIKLSFLSASGIVFGSGIRAANPYSGLSKEKTWNTTQPTNQNNWFFEKRFGMFVHWGLYAIPAVHEQYQQRYNIPKKQYELLAKQWNPVNFKPDEWLDIMQDAGMEYLTFTTKHHDGFCMWDTKQTSFNVMNTPYKKDILKKLADACHKRSIPLSLYYSVVDWHHPNYPNKGRHHELPKPKNGDDPDWGKYTEFLKAQVRELCINYGKISGFWWDMNVPKYKDPSINAMIRELQPGIFINNRGFDEGDFGTPERDYDNAVQNTQAFSRPTEACQSVGMQSWGYRRNEDYYSDRYLMKSIDKNLSHGANYLLNVGPDATGIIPKIPENILRRIGRWYKLVKESYQNVVRIEYPISNSNIILSGNEKVMYVHLNKIPKGDMVNLNPLKTMPAKATILNTGENAECVVERVPYEKESFLFIRNLPVNKFSNEVLVIKLVFDNPIKSI